MVFSSTVENTGDGNTHHDHADWDDAKFICPGIDNDDTAASDGT